MTPAFPGGTTLSLGTTFALGSSFGTTFSLGASALEGPASPVAGAWAGCTGRRAACAAGAAAATATARGALGLQLHRCEAFRGVQARNIDALKSLNGAQLPTFRGFH